MLRENRGQLGVREGRDRSLQRVQRGDRGCHVGRDELLVDSLGKVAGHVGMLRELWGLCPCLI